MNQSSLWRVNYRKTSNLKFETQLPASPCLWLIAVCSALCCWLLSSVITHHSSLFFLPTVFSLFYAILFAEMNVKVIIERGEDGYFVAHVPALKSCWSQGKTRDEALQNIREAIDLYLEPSPKDLVEDANHEVVSLSL